MGDFVATILDQLGLAGDAHPKGKLKAARVVVRAGEGLLAGAPDGRAELRAGLGFREARADGGQLFENRLGGLALERIDFLRSKRPRRRLDAHLSIDGG